MLSSDRDVLNGVINALADIMAVAKEMGELDKKKPEEDKTTGEKSEEG